MLINRRFARDEVIVVVINYRFLITTSYSFACENVTLVQQFTDQGDINSLTGFSGIRITQYLFLCVVVCPPLFVFSFSFVLSVLLG